jgi:ABC-2 type transport system permease protein
MRLEGLPVFALILVGLTGFGFMLGGVTLVFKQVTQLGNLAENFIMYLSGVLIPVANMPELLGAFAKTLPTTQGIIVLGNVVLEGQSLGSAWADGSLGLLIVHSSIYLALGWVVFKWSEKLARRQGSLGQY